MLSSLPPTYLNHYSRVAKDSNTVDEKSRDLLTKTSFTLVDGRLVAKTENVRITTPTSERPGISIDRSKSNIEELVSEPEIKDVSGKDGMIVVHEVGTHGTQSPRKRKDIEFKCERMIKRLKKTADPKQSSILTYFSAKSPKKVQDPARKVVTKSECEKAPKA